MRMPRTLLFFFAALMLAFCDRVDAAEAQDAANNGSDLSFLELGRDYEIRFPEDKNVFTVKRGGTYVDHVTNADTGEKLPPRLATWSATMSVEVFRVLRFGGGSWVLLEHPNRSDDFIKWNTKRRAMARLAAIDMGSTVSDDAELLKLRKSADEVFETATTWVNLDHAVAITDVPTEKLQWKAVVESATLNRK